MSAASTVHAMDLLMPKLQALAGAADLDAFDNECQGLDELLERAGAAATGSPAAARGVGAGASGAGLRCLLLPALANALATALRLLFPCGGVAGWVVQDAPPDAAGAAALLAKAFQSASGVESAEEGSLSWPADALMRLLQRTGGRDCLCDQHAARSTSQPGGSNLCVRGMVEPPQCALPCRRQGKCACKDAWH